MPMTDTAAPIRALLEEMRNATGANPIGPLFAAGYCAAAKTYADKLEPLLASLLRETPPQPEADHRHVWTAIGDDDTVKCIRCGLPRPKEGDALESNQHQRGSGSDDGRIARQTGATAGGGVTYPPDNTSTDESRSPDGDGLPMVKGLRDGASLTSMDGAGTAATGQRTRSLRGTPESSLKSADGSEPSDSRSPSPLDRKPQDIEQARRVLSTLCHFIWHKELRPGEHLWSIPVDAERDFDCVLSDIIDELEQKRAEVERLRTALEHAEHVGWIRGEAAVSAKLRADEADAELARLRESAPQQPDNQKAIALLNRWMDEDKLSSGEDPGVDAFLEWLKTGGEAARVPAEPPLLSLEKRIDDTVQAIGERFRTFGGGRDSRDNPIAHAMRNEPLSFAANVDVRAVVEFVLRSALPAVGASHPKE